MSKSPSFVEAIDALLDDEEVSRITGIKTKTLAVWRWRRVGPPFVQLGPRMPRYRRVDIEEWIAARAVQVKP